MFQRIINWIIKTIGIDRLLHFLVSAVLVFGIACFLPTWVAAIVAFGLGLLKEIVDAITGNGADLVDLIADVAGVGFACLLLWLGSSVI